RPGRRLLEDEGDLLAGEAGDLVPPVLRELQGLRELEQEPELRRLEVDLLQEAPVPKVGRHPSPPLWPVRGYLPPRPIWTRSAELRRGRQRLSYATGTGPGTPGLASSPGGSQRSARGPASWFVRRLDQARRAAIFFAARLAIP